jgi:high-affinity nickel permease
VDLLAIVAAVAEPASAGALLTTALVLGIRHGIDWDHIAAITDITSTTAAADAGEERHVAEHRAGAHDPTPPSSRCR